MFPIVIERVSEPYWLEKLSWAAEIILVFVAGGSFIAAALALREAARARRATLLLQLDERFDAPMMKDARSLMRTKMDQAINAAGSANPITKERQRAAAIREEWARQLGQLRTSDIDTYMKLLVFAGFFETVGLMVKLNYISATDVIRLFEAPILDVETAFREHAADREKETGMPDGFLEHALFLASVARRRAKKSATIS